MDYIIVKDIITQETFSIIILTESNCGKVVTKDGVVTLPKRSLGKALRTWMKTRKNG